MKHFHIIPILFALTIFLSSCSNDSNPPVIDISNLFSDDFEYTYSDDKPYTEYDITNASSMLEYSDGEIYFWGGQPSEKFVTICRLNPETGIVTSMCPYTLCDHNSPECPFFGMRPAFYVNDGRIFYKRQYTYTERNDDGSKSSVLDVSDSVYYDMTTSKVKILDPDISKEGAEYLKQLFTDNNRYYYDYIFDADINEYRFVMCRQNIDNGDVTIVGGDNNVDTVLEQFVFTLNDRIYFTDGTRLYSRNKDNKDETTLCTGHFGENVLTDGSNIYFDIYENGSRNVYRMTDMSDYSTADKIISDCDSWYLTENYIYYIDSGERVIGKNEISGRTGDEIILSGNNIRRCDHDGANDTLIFSFDNEYRNYEHYDKLVVGNYLYCLFAYWDDSDGDGIFRDGDQIMSNVSNDFRIMRVNLTDGSVFIIKGIY